MRWNRGLADAGLDQIDAPRAMARQLRSMEREILSSVAFRMSDGRCSQAGLRPVA